MNTTRAPIRLTNNWFFILIKISARWCKPRKAIVRWGSLPTNSAIKTVGPFHCKHCAETVADYGLTEQGAFEYCHGTPDQKFFAMFGDC